jgi:hypothetical protein
VSRASRPQTPLSPRVAFVFPRPLLALLLAVVVALSLAGCSDPDETERQVEVNPTPIDAFVVDAVQVSRASFCSRIADDAVTAAIGDVSSTRHYGNGEQARVASGVRDVAHEYSCTFVGSSGDVARAWVFVPRVTRSQARALVAGVRLRAGCRLLDGYSFGSPGTGSLCVSGGRKEAAYRGLFVDAWLTCSVTDGGREKLAEKVLLKKAGDWCVQVATATAD